jgi:argininosuccinate lyase
MKTWSGGKLDNGSSSENVSEERKKVEKFLDGKDVLLDQKLVKWEVLSTISHQIMLNKIGVLTGDELKQILKELVAMYEQGTGRCSRKRRGHLD